MNEMEGSFDEPVEELMFYTAVLVLLAGRESKYTRDLISNDINKLVLDHGLEELLARISVIDAKRVRADLDLLGVLLFR